MPYIVTLKNVKTSQGTEFREGPKGQISSAQGYDIGSWRRWGLSESCYKELVKIDIRLVCEGPRR